MRVSRVDHVAGGGGPVAVARWRWPVVVAVARSSRLWSIDRDRCRMARGPRPLTAPWDPPPVTGRPWPVTPTAASGPQLMAGWPHESAAVTGDAHRKQGRLESWTPTPTSADRAAPTSPAQATPTEPAAPTPTDLPARSPIDRRGGPVRCRWPDRGRERCRCPADRTRPGRPRLAGALRRRVRPRSSGPARDLGRRCAGRPARADQDRDRPRNQLRAITPAATDPGTPGPGCRARRRARRCPGRGRVVRLLPQDPRLHLLVEGHADHSWNVSNCLEVWKAGTARLSQLGARVPGDIAIVGYDDIDFAADSAGPADLGAPAQVPARPDRRETPARRGQPLRAARAPPLRIHPRADHPG